MPAVCGMIEHPYSRAEVTPGAPASEESDRPGADPRPDDDGGAAQPSPQRVDLKTDSDEDDESEHSFEGCWTTLAENPEMLHGNRGDGGPPGRRAPPLVSVAQPSRPRGRVRKKTVKPGTTARTEPSGKARRTAATTGAPRGAAIPTPNGRRKLPAPSSSAPPPVEAPLPPPPPAPDEATNEGKSCAAGASGTGPRRNKRRREASPPAAASSRGTRRRRGPTLCAESVT